MNALKYACMIPASLIMGSCALHPLPEDFSQYYTLNIAHSIRCEARDGFRVALGGIMADKRDDGTYRYGYNTYTLGEQLSSGKASLEALDKGHRLQAGLDPEVLYIVDQLDKGSIGYLFNLTMTEENKNQISLGLADNLLPGIFGANASAKGELKRENERQFRIIDPFETFYAPRMGRKCREDIASGRKNPNIAYPITGKIGLEDVIFTHFILSDSIGLASLGKDNVTELSEKLDFTTTIYGEVKPTITLSPETRNFHVTSLSGEFSANRVDHHTVTIALALAANTWRKPEDAASGASTTRPRAAPSAAKPRTPTRTRIPSPESTGANTTSETEERVNRSLDILRSEDSFGRAIEKELEKLE